MRIDVPLRRAYRLLNHGPTTLISSAAGGRTNVMAAAWVMPLDFDPPKLCVVIEGDSHTRKLVEESGELVVNVPPASMLDTVYAVGQVSGATVNKLAQFNISTTPASQVKAPLIVGALAWLECRIVPEPRMAERYDLFVAEVLAAWAEDSVFVDGQWCFKDPAHRTLHHVAKGTFLTIGEMVSAKPS